MTPPLPEVYITLTFKQGSQKLSSLKCLNIKKNTEAGHFTPPTIINSYLYKILGRKTAKNVQTDPKTKDIWSTKLNVTL